MKNKSVFSKIWAKCVIGATAAALLLCAILTAVIDPFFHYRAPLQSLEYPLTNERYINNGIMKNFTYDAILSGTSMIQNFKTSEIDAFWKANSIKVPFEGASYKEINDNLERALNYNTEIKYVLRGLDCDELIADKDAMKDEENLYPWYLYDDNVFNDAGYLLNKNVLFQHDMEVIKNRVLGREGTSFDEYGNWNDKWPFGKEAVLEQYDRPIERAENLFTEQDQVMVEANVEQNITALARKFPNVTFYYFFTPFSICYWDSLQREGELNRYIDAEEMAIQQILQEQNIKLFSFSDRFDMVCDLDNYRDITHYSQDICSQMIAWIHSGSGMLTEENYKEYIEKIRTFYNSYPYDAIFDSSIPAGE